MKKILMLTPLVFAGYLYAAPAIAPAPPVVEESNLSFSAQEIEQIKKSDTKPQDNLERDEKGALKKSIGNDRDGVKVIQLGGDTIEEYRRGGAVYQIRVIPKVGKPYFVQPENANKNNDNKSSNPTSNWKVFSF